jgi:hypothetical protein
MTTHLGWRIETLLVAVALCWSGGQDCVLAATEGPPDTLTSVLESMGKLEGVRDPKCDATANRLEDFMYGTPLAHDARVEKTVLQKRLLRQVWEEASQAARLRGALDVAAEDLAPIRQAVAAATMSAGGDWTLATVAGSITVTARDKRQYGNVAYAQRAILAVQQEALLEAETMLLPLSLPAVESLKEFLDLVTLAALQRADQEARRRFLTPLDAATLREAWTAAFPPHEPAPPAATRPGEQILPSSPAARERYATLRAVNKEKLAAFAKYNDLTLPVFMRNIQVYFARHRWPTDEAESEALRGAFTETMVAFAHDLLLEAEKEARRANRSLIGLDDVHAALERFCPYELNSYEDVIYFPRLPRADRVTIEAYDLDSFRDPGLHWFYLDQVVSDPGFSGQLEPDPFAAELLTEGIAQFGVLVLRLAGEEAKAAQAPRLSAVHLAGALRRIQRLLDASAASPPRPAAPAPLVSSGAGSAESSAPAPGTPPGAHYFADITAQAGIGFKHRSSDWLARLTRSLLVSPDGAGKLAIPPAFGGAGVAAEDIDGDGDVDLLFLGGGGIQLYLSDGRGKFADATASSGLAWRRPDGHPGEPRQPIVADFDNDGRQDVLITYVDDDHRLYRNLGGARFADVTTRAGLGGAGLTGGPATAADFDNDGLLDVFLGYFGDYPRGTLPTLSRRSTNGLPDKIFRNLGGLRFEERTAGSGVDNPGWAQAVGHVDFDRDGRQDLIVGNDFGANAYYRNLGAFRFEDVAAQLGADKPSYTMNVGLTDLNRDGFPDIYISNIVTMNKDEKYVLPDANTPMKLDPKKLATMRVVEANDLWMSRAVNGKLDGYERSRAVGRGESSTGWAWDADFFDFDLDGDDDLYVVNGMNEYAVYSSVDPYFTDASGKRQDVMVPVSPAERNVLFVNRGGRLEEDAEASGLDLAGNSRSAAYFDLEGDGDLDIALNNFHGDATVFRNDAAAKGRQWLKVFLVGDPSKGSTRDAIGARIQVDSANQRGLVREVTSTIGYLSVHPKQQHFGLGADTSATVTVVWPNGDTQRFAEVATNRAYTVRQGGAIERVAEAAQSAVRP